MQWKLSIKLFSLLTIGIVDAAGDLICEIVGEYTEIVELNVSFGSVQILCEKESEIFNLNFG